MRHLHYAGCLIFLLLVLQGCATIPRYQAQGEFLDETVRTTVDAEIARYYLENYLQGKRNNPSFDKKIDRLYQKQGSAHPTREELKEISRTFSVDFATLFLADRLLAIEENQKLHKRFNQFLQEKKAEPYSPPAHYSSYIVLFVPGWDYVEHGHVTGADLSAPRKLVTDLGIENHLVEISPHGSVEENADYISQELIEYSQTGKNIIISGPSSAGPAIHLSLGERLNQEHLQSVKAWINLGGILQGTPVVDYLQQWPRSWGLNMYMWWRGWDSDELTSMAIEPSRKRFERLSISEDVLIINYIGFPLSGQVSQYSQDKYPLFAPEGPNDGLTWLTDAMAPNSMTLIALGNDHFLAQDPRIDEKTVALAKTVIFYLEKDYGAFTLYQEMTDRREPF
ncbi:MAG: hypothetical protein JSU59_02320 [Nitrospirota bacterium]|nr:MAG: hypothetical protein JSU59_02320 [Nitrospirota bacterium]